MQDQEQRELLHSNPFAAPKQNKRKKQKQKQKKSSERINASVAITAAIKANQYLAPSNRRCSAHSCSQIHTAHFEAFSGGR
jgi:hypothetical protein